MTKKELIETLAEYPDDIQIIGYNHGNYAGKVELKQIRVTKDLKYYDDSWQSPADEYLQEVEGEGEKVILLDWY